MSYKSQRICHCQIKCIMNKHIQMETREKRDRNERSVVDVMFLRVRNDIAIVLFATPVLHFFLSDLIVF